MIEADERKLCRLCGTRHMAEFYGADGHVWFMCMHCDDGDRYGGHPQPKLAQPPVPNADES